MSKVGQARLAVESIMLKRVWLPVSFAVVISITSVFVEGLPILGPDLNNCMPVWLTEKVVAEPLDCCFVDTSRPAKQFKFNLDQPMRVRRPAHKLDDVFVRKYERAVELMKALPPEDPRSFESQIKMHCAYCLGVYNQFNSSMHLQVHVSALFLPFHRWFLYFHERILASLIEDDSFAVPYWAWDVQHDVPKANSLPAIYMNKNSVLYDENRSKNRNLSSPVDLQYLVTSGDRNPDVVIQDNNYVMWQAMISQAKSPDAFYGKTISRGDRWDLSRGGSLELGPHGTIHSWVGDDDMYGEDLAPPYSAARDVIFFGHHSQIDRLWLMWKGWGGKDSDDTDWLDSEFLFYDENSDLVRVNVRDSLNFSNFRIGYEYLESDWVKFPPKSIRKTDPKYAQASILSRLWKVVSGGTSANIAMILGSFFLKETKNGEEFSLGGERRKTVTSRVSRSELLRIADYSSVDDELLVIRGFVDNSFDASVLIKVFLELPEANENTPQHCVEFLGALKIDAEEIAVARKFSRTFRIKDSLQILGIIHQKSVSVTFVPAWDLKLDPQVVVRVTNLKVEPKSVQGNLS